MTTAERSEYTVTMKVPEKSAATIAHRGEQYVVDDKGLIKVRPSDVAELEAHGLTVTESPTAVNFATSRAKNFATARAEQTKR